VFYGGQVVGESAMNFLEDIGPEVIHGYEVCYTAVSIFALFVSESVAFSIISSCIFCSACHALILHTWNACRCLSSRMLLCLSVNLEWLRVCQFVVVQVTYKGSGNVRNIQVVISWPYELQSVYASGKHLLYLAQLPQASYFLSDVSERSVSDNSTLYGNLNYRMCIFLQFTGFCLVLSM